MKFQNGAEALINSSTKLAIFRQLTRWPARSWTGRELARESGVSPAQAIRDLDVFKANGVVDVTVLGRSHVWRLNSEHVLVVALSRLFANVDASLDELVKDLREGLKGGPAEEVRLFGSVARGEEVPESDIDLFVRVGSTRDRTRVETQIEGFRDRIWRKYGNSLSPIIYTNAEARGPVRAELLVKIEREGIDVLQGGPRSVQDGIRS